MLTLIYSQLIFCTIGYNFIYKGALGLSQLFFPVVPFASELYFFSFPSHLLPFFHFHKDICILVMSLPFSLPVQLCFFFPECIAFNLLLCFLFFQLSWGYLKLVSPTLKSHHTVLLFADFGAWSWGCFYTGITHEAMLPIPELWRSTTKHFYFAVLPVLGNLDISFTCSSI